jgi:hypothetical protein
MTLKSAKRREPILPNMPDLGAASRWHGRTDEKAGKARSEALALATSIVQTLSRGVLIEARDSLLDQRLSPKTYDKILSGLYAKGSALLPVHLLNDLRLIQYQSPYVQAYSALGSDDVTRIGVLRDALLANSDLCLLLRSMDVALPQPLSNRISLDQEVFRSKFFKGSR